jgi:hypothetical protein
MKTLKFDDQLIFPVYIEIENDKHAILFKIDDNYLAFMDNKILEIDYQALKDKSIYYPENGDELLQMKNALDYIYNRLLFSIQNQKEKALFNVLTEIIERVDLLNEKLLYKKLKIKFEGNQ